MCGDNEFEAAENYFCGRVAQNRAVLSGESA